MRNAMSLLALSVAVLGASPAALAEGRWYGSVSGGYLVADDVGGTVQGQSVEGSYDDGYAVFGAIGYKHSSGFRAEVELGYGSAGVDSVSVNGTEFGADGDLDLFTGTLNGFYDVDTGTRLTPYFGGGAGIAQTEISDVRVGGVTFGGDDATDPILLGEAGLKYAVTPDFDLGIGYRYSYIFDGHDGIDDNSGHLFKATATFSF